MFPKSMKHFKTEIADKIMTPRGLEARGMYKDKIMTFVENPLESTFPHEFFHGAFDIFLSPEQKVDLLVDVKQRQKLQTSLEAEERMAEKFAEYVKDVESGKKPNKTL